jgi:excisionase family DNA binding protein
MDALLMTTDEAAAALRISKGSVDYLAAQGLLPVVHIGRARRFRVADVTAFAEKLAAQPAPGRPGSKAAPKTRVASGR